jgi:cbb3-type cytochrome oxidase subunit 1
MDWFVKAFIKASVTWLTLGFVLGISMAVHPAWTVYRAAHVHVMLLGFVAMMIFGVAYHVIPRFSSHQLYSSRAAGWHWWIANAGVALMTVGFLCRDSGHLFGTWVLSAGGLLSGAGTLIFAVQIWRTIDGPAPHVQLNSRTG